MRVHASMNGRPHQNAWRGCCEPFTPVDGLYPPQFPGGPSDAISRSSTRKKAARSFALSAGSVASRLARRNMESSLIGRPTPDFVTKFVTIGSNLRVVRLYPSYIKPSFPAPVIRVLRDQLVAARAASAYRRSPVALESKVRPYRPSSCVLVRALQQSFS